MLKLGFRIGSGRRFVCALLASCAVGLGVFEDASHASVTTYAYDNAGRLVIAQIDQATVAYKTTYSLDPAGNRTTVTTVGTPVVITFTAATASTSSINLTFSATDTGGPGGLTYAVTNNTLSRSVPSCTASPCARHGSFAGYQLHLHNRRDGLEQQYRYRVHQCLDAPGRTRDADLQCNRSDVGHGQLDGAERHRERATPTAPTAGPRGPASETSYRLRSQDSRAGRAIRSRCVPRTPEAQAVPAVPAPSTRYRAHRAPRRSATSPRPLSPPAGRRRVVR